MLKNHRRKTTIDAKKTTNEKTKKITKWLFFQYFNYFTLFRSYTYWFVFYQTVVTNFLTANHNIFN